MHLVIDSTGQVFGVYAEAINLASLGSLDIRRASHVEPDAQGQWWADLAPVGGRKLGPMDRRSEALAAENAWLQEHLLICSTVLFVNNPDNQAPESLPAQAGARIDTTHCLSHS